MAKPKPRHTEESMDRALVQLFDWRTEEAWSGGYSALELMELINKRNKGRRPLEPESAEDQALLKEVLAGLNTEVVYRLPGIRKEKPAPQEAEPEIRDFRKRPPPEYRWGRRIN